jgi:sugar lactone lactonase YvrE
MATNTTGRRFPLICANPRFIFLLIVAFMHLTSAYAQVTHLYTVAGQDGVFGGGNSQLNSPAGIFVDAHHNIYIADGGNNRVVKWPKDSFTCVTVAGDPAGTAGSTPDRLNVPQSVYVDTAGYIYISDAGNNRVQKWAPGAHSGVTVAGSSIGTAGVADSLLSSPHGIWLDTAGAIYVADQLNNRVQKWMPGALSGVTVAGSAAGSGGLGGDQLSGPAGISIDMAGNVYIADAGNNRVQKWAPGATQGLTVAGDSAGNTSIFNNRLSFPRAVFLDTAGALYVADGGANRVQKWPAGARQGTTVAGNHYAVIGLADSLLNLPQGVFIVDSFFYVCDYGNHRIVCNQRRKGTARGIDALSDLVMTSVSPNPSHGRFAIVIDAATGGEASLSVCDLTGRVVSTIHTAVYQGSNLIDCSALGLSPAVYIYELRLNGAAGRGRVVID